MFRPRVSHRRILACALAAMVTAAAAPAFAQDTTDGPEVRGYGDQGTSEISLHLGAGTNYFAAGLGFRYYVVDGIAPGFEGSYLRSHGIGQGLALGSVRFAPLRFAGVIPVVTARGGPVFLSNHPSGWAAGADAGILILVSRHVAFEIGYGFLKLFPESFCADLETCVIYQPTLGVRVTF